MNLVKRRACSFGSPWLVRVRTIGSVFVISSGVNWRVVKWLRDESGVLGYGDSGCSSINSYRGLSGSCGLGLDILPIYLKWFCGYILGITRSYYV